MMGDTSRVSFSAHAWNSIRDNLDIAADDLEERINIALENYRDDAPETEIAMEVSPSERASINAAFNRSNLNHSDEAAE